MDARAYTVERTERGDSQSGFKCHKLDRTDDAGFTPGRTFQTGRIGGDISTPQTGPAACAMARSRRELNLPWLGLGNYHSSTRYVVRPRETTSSAERLHIKAMETGSLRPKDSSYIRKAQLDQAGITSGAWSNQSLLFKEMDWAAARE